MALKFFIVLLPPCFTATSREIAKPKPKPS